MEFFGAILFIGGFGMNTLLFYWTFSRYSKDLSQGDILEAIYLAILFGFMLLSGSVILS